MPAILTILLDFFFRWRLPVFFCNINYKISELRDDACEGKGLACVLIEIHQHCGLLSPELST